MYVNLLCSFVQTDDMMLFIFVADRGGDSSSSSSNSRWGGDKQLEETPDTVFITGLNPDIDEEGLKQHFGSIGIIKVCYIKDECYIENIIFM